MEAASSPIQYRALAEAAPEGSRDPERLAELAKLAAAYKPAQAIVRKQKDTGLWGPNLLAPGANKTFGWTEAGTITQYRHLLEMGWSPDERVFRIALDRRTHASDSGLPSTRQRLRSCSGSPSIRRTRVHTPDCRRSVGRTRSYSSLPSNACARLPDRRRSVEGGRLRGRVSGDQDCSGRTCITCGHGT